MLDNAALQQYLTRVGYEGPTAANVQTLHALTAAHSTSIAFENLDVLSGQGISLDPDHIFDKLVMRQRGGYCFEQNLLLARVLKTLGFDVVACGARVRLQDPDRDVMPGRTHLFLIVRIDGDIWLTDVGFGAQSLTGALRLQADVIQDTPHGPRRLEHVDGRWFHQVPQSTSTEDWQDVYEFTLDPMLPRDRVIANWYTSTHPDAVFTDNLTAARARPDGTRITIFNDKFCEIQSDGTRRCRDLDAQGVLAALRDEFGLKVPASPVLMQWLQDHVDSDAQAM